MTKTVIVIPARYASSRLPGKPLARIAGQTMLERVVRIAQSAISDNAGELSVLVATDDERVQEHALSLEVSCEMTPADCPSGTDRAAAALQQRNETADFVLILQGDAPLTPPDFLQAMIRSFESQPTDVVTPVTQLTWDELDLLRQQKESTPFSGTTAVFEPNTGRALWFSKNILPAIRSEAKLRHQSPLSPVYRHIGLYGYSGKMLQSYPTLAKGYYEEMEGLEQLRLLEAGHSIRCVPVDYAGRANMSGVDSPEDVVRAEHLIAQYGELLPA